jgi:hypothetical protein
MADNIRPYPRNNPRDRSLRASDADRDAIGDILRRQHVAGRLDTDEFSERYGRCLQARTYAELDQLISDLPADPEPAFAAGAAPFGTGRAGNRTRVGGPRWAGRFPWPVHVFAWLALVLAVAVASGGRLLWVAFPLLFLFVVRPLIWRSAQGGRWGPWGCHPGYAGRGTTAL